MRKLNWLAILLFVPMLALGQAELNRGTVRYEMVGMTAGGADDPSIFTIYFAPGIASTVLSMPSGEEALSVLYNYQENRAYMIFREKRKSLVTPVTLEELSVAGAEFEDYVAENIKSKGKTILGYPCREVRIRLVDGAASSQRVHAWVTDDIHTPCRIANGLESLLGGFPLEITFNMGSGAQGDQVVYKAVDISPAVNADMLKLPE
ncbi:MAG: DUF4412 domain-containing protein [Lewinellaceae bacterium]|nr:DUF4412 domain-containing protein [Lewinellaceae bacterium]